MYFTLCHDAEDVDYEYNDFLYKDFDKLDQNMVNFMNAKGDTVMDPLIIKIYWGKTDPDEAEDKKDKNCSLAKKFQTQIQDLMDTLLECNCHFVRCMKPNPLKTDRYLFFNTRHLIFLDEIIISQGI